MARGSTWGRSSYCELLAADKTMTPMENAVFSHTCFNGINVFVAVETPHLTRSWHLFLPRVDVFFYMDGSGESDVEMVTSKSVKMTPAPLWCLNETDFPDAYQLWVISFKTGGQFVWLHITKSGWLLYGTRRKVRAVHYSTFKTSALSIIRALRALPNQDAIRALLESTCATALWKGDVLTFTSPAAFEDSRITATPRRLGPYSREELCQFAALAPFRCTVSPKRGYVIVDSTFSTVMLCETVWYLLTRAAIENHDTSTTLLHSFVCGAQSKGVELHLNEAFMRDSVMPYIRALAMELAVYVSCKPCVRLRDTPRIMAFVRDLHKACRLSCVWSPQPESTMQTWFHLSDTAKARVESATGIAVDFDATACKSNAVVHSAAAFHWQQLWEAPNLELALHAFEIEQGALFCRCTVQYPLVHAALSTLDECCLRVQLGRVAAASLPPHCAVLILTQCDIGLVLK